MKPLSGWYDEDFAVPVATLARRHWKSRAAHSLCEATGLDDPVAAMQQRAAELVSESELNRPGKKLQVLASLQDIRTIEAVDMAETGRLIPTHGGLVVQVNARNSPERRNFTACHEIAHTLVPSYHEGAQERADAQVGCYGEEEEEEYLCDVGASELLMPLEEFKPLLKQGMARGENLLVLLPSLSMEFAASLEATAIRIVRVDKTHLALLVWQPVESQAAYMAALCEDGSKTQRCRESVAMLPPLYVQYACRAGEMETYFFPGNICAPLGSLIVQAQREEIIVSGHQELTTNRGLIRFWMHSKRFPCHRTGVGNNRVFTFLRVGKYISSRMW